MKKKSVIYPKPFRWCYNFCLDENDIKLYDLLAATGVYSIPAGVTVTTGLCDRRPLEDLDESKDLAYTINRHTPVTIESSKLFPGKIFAHLSENLCGNL